MTTPIDPSGLDPRLIAPIASTICWPTAGPVEDRAS